MGPDPVATATMSTNLAEIAVGQLTGFSPLVTALVMAPLKRDGGDANMAMRLFQVASLSSNSKPPSIGAGPSRCACGRKF